MSAKPGFDRLRPRTADDWTPPRASVVDTDGKRALFSSGAPSSAVGSVRVTCSSCAGTSVIGLAQALRMTVPSLHLPLIKRGYPSFARCPACHRMTWLRIKLVLSGAAGSAAAPRPAARR